MRIIIAEVAMVLLECLGRFTEDERRQIEET